MDRRDTWQEVWGQVQVMEKCGSEFQCSVTQSVTQIQIKFSFRFSFIQIYVQIQIQIQILSQDWILSQDQIHIHIYIIGTELHREGWRNRIPVSDGTWLQLMCCALSRPQCPNFGGAGVQQG